MKDIASNRTFREMTADELDLVTGGVAVDPLFADAKTGVITNQQSVNPYNKWLPGMMR